MLNFQIIKNEKNAIEKYVYEPLKNSQFRQMSYEETKVMFKIAMAEKTLVIPEEEIPFTWRLIEKRLNLHNIVIKEHSVLLSLSIFLQSAGDAIMTLWYIQGKCNELKIKEVTFEVFTTQLFPFGFITQETFKKVWEGQKVTNQPKFASDNLVDYYVLGETLFTNIK